MHTSIKLPNGQVLKNRFAKAAMSEGLADAMNRATPAHVNLYERWGRSGAGLLISGNVQIDRSHLERPGNVVLDQHTDTQSLDTLREMAEKSQCAGSRMWLQISHPGRAVLHALNPAPLAPSSVPLVLPGVRFGAPKAMQEDEILHTIEQFVFAAQQAEELGFAGVQIHAAHGYLLNQFLSPLTNRRDDDWSGPLPQRARLLLEVVKQVRAGVGPDFAVGVKLNTSDFQKGGFSIEESMQVAQWLEEAGIDLLELSGGNYEEPVMAEAKGGASPSSEAFFASYAASIKQKTSLPLLVTGGIRSKAAIEHILENQMADMIGIGRPLIENPSAIQEMLDGKISRFATRAEGMKMRPAWLVGPTSPFVLFRRMNGFGILNWYCLQVQELARGNDTPSNLGVFGSLRRYAKQEKQATIAMFKARGKAS